MKLKFYLRGIGIGIIVAVAICVCAGRGGNKKMTDAQIRARAIELGMVDEGSVIADTLVGNEDKKEEQNAPVKVEIEPIIEPDEAEEIAVNDVIDDSIESTEPLEESQNEEDLVEETNEETNEEASEEVSVEAKEESVNEPAGEFVTIIIEKGNGSDTAARKLAEAGLIDDAAAYDRWLIENGYDRRISAGSHRIPKGASKEEIARIISGG